MSDEPMIERAKTTSEKGFNYSENIRRLNKAVREEFYYEALLIDGALIEDRLHSFLYHLGVFAGRTDRTACRAAKAQLRVIRNRYVGKPDDGLRVSMISDKIELVRSTLLWFEDLDCAPDDDPYLHALWTQYASRIDDPDDFLDVLSRIDTWRNYRNEIAHGLLNKNMTVVNEVLEGQCREGEALFRAVDAYVSRVKYRNIIRRAAKLPTSDKL